MHRISPKAIPRCQEPDRNIKGGSVDVNRTATDFADQVMMRGIVTQMKHRGPMTEVHMTKQTLGLQGIDGSVDRRRRHLGRHPYVDPFEKVTGGQVQVVFGREDMTDCLAGLGDS